MKTTSIIISAILSIALLGTACKKETRSTEAPYGTETTVYATAQNKVLKARAAYFSPPVPDGGTSTERAWYQIALALDDNEIKDRWIRNDTLFTKRLFEPTDIVGMDLFVLNDYDEEHPKGSSIADLLRIATTGLPTAMGLSEYFETYGSLAWREGEVCRLIATQLPWPDYNHSEFFDLWRPTGKHQGFGAVLRLTLEDGTHIEIKPSAGKSPVYYAPKTAPAIGK